MYCDAESGGAAFFVEKAILVTARHVITVS